MVSAGGGGLNGVESSAAGAGIGVSKDWERGLRQLKEYEKAGETHGESRQTR